MTNHNSDMGIYKDFINISDVVNLEESLVI